MKTLGYINELMELELVVVAKLDREYSLTLVSNHVQ